MADSKFNNACVCLLAVVWILSASWSSSTAAQSARVGGALNSAMQKYDTQSGVPSRPGVSPNRGAAPSADRSMSSYQTRSSSGGRNSRGNYSNNYFTNYSNNYRYNSRNNNYYGSRRSNSGAYFTGGLLLGSWLGSYNRYDPYYYGNYSNRYSGGYYNSGYYSNRYYNSPYNNTQYNNVYRGSYYNNGFPSSTGVRYYRSAPVEPTVIYREKIVSDSTARDAKESHMLRDLEGNCYEITYSASGQELRLQVPREQCQW